jgi:HSP20 family protein
MNDLTSVPTKTRVAARAESPFGWLRNEVDRLFDEFGTPARGIFNFGAQFAPLPAIEMAEREKDYRLTAELPGLQEDDVEISVVDGVLTLSGEKREEADREEEGRTISERRYGAFSRQIPLPADVDPETISATFKKGVLTVTMGKDANLPARSRKIAIAKA